MSQPQCIRADHYKPVLDFNKQNKERIEQLCAPLKECFGLSAVAYLKNIDDGKYLMLSNNETFLMTPPRYDFFLRTGYFGKQAQLFCKTASSMDVWADQGKDHCINMYKEKGLHNGFSMVREKDGYLECIWFCNEDAGGHMGDFYRSHREILMRYLEDFRRLASDLTDTTEMSRLGTSPYLQNKYPRIDDIFMNSTPWERQIECFNNQIDSLFRQEIVDISHKHALTPRELECLTYFTTNKTAKEIARIINVSHRTVEKHLDNIRLKTGLHSKQKLTHWFQDKFRHVFTQQ